MNKCIWKYELPVDGYMTRIDEWIVEPLHIENQNGMPTLWALVMPEKQWDGYTEIVAIGTGWNVPDHILEEWVYMGTCGDGAGYIWHYWGRTVVEEEYMDVLDDLELTRITRV